MNDAKIHDLKEDYEDINTYCRTLCIPDKYHSRSSASSGVYHRLVNKYGSYPMSVATRVYFMWYGNNGQLDPKRMY